jgi:hypothetical protein
MKVVFRLVISVCVFVIINLSGYSQENKKSEINKSILIDSLKNSGIIFREDQRKPDIRLSTNQALIYLRQRYHPQFWNNTNDPLRQAFGRLIYEAEHQPVDSLRNMLMNFPYDSLTIPWDKFYIWEPLRLKIPVIPDMEFHVPADSALRADSLKVTEVYDSARVYSDMSRQSGFLKPPGQLKDTTIMVIIDTLKEVRSSYPEFPFRYFNYPYQNDSIKAAVGSLLEYLQTRDSSIVNISGVGKTITPIMMNSKSPKVMRYWLKNEFSDSVTIWISNPARNTIGLYLEQGVAFRRPVRQGNYSSARVDIKPLDNQKLLEIQHIALKSQNWKYHTDASYILNQAALSNWVRGGEGSVSTSLDITGYVDYNNKKLKVSSNNFARLKFGYIATGKEGIRKNLDLLETNSKLNHKAFGKFDFSAILLFKTQIAKGRNYFNDASGKETSQVVSKFMNPAILTVGFGLDYKPNKTTSINFSPLSYKGTFVTDPAYFNNRFDSARIDQTKYGIAKNRKSLNEPGASFMISNEFKPTDRVTIVNRLQLFTNYIHNPQNVDVDWELIATARLNWFTDVRLNTHLIFDDDTKTNVLDSHDQPVLRPDGTEKKTARIQFKEMLGFSLFFRF